MRAILPGWASRIGALGLSLALLATMPAWAGEPGDREPNRLIHESSPYLRLHAYNPVDWYPWGSEALERAREEGKPIFLSIGYSTCYWCHVMEREVFADSEIAERMNRWFVNIKVDREERPDLDEIYMVATQLVTRRGGWPNSVFLTPELEPFFAGTYFPPEDRGGRPGFPTVLESLHQAWETKRGEVKAHAARIARAIERAIGGPLGSAAAAPELEDAEAVAAGLAKSFDAQRGGFGGGPKFPSPSNLFLLWGRARAGDAQAREIVLTTLHKMGEGAIYDQLDGGFHRYTLDAAWRIPHFEKMLYDNALLADLLAVVGTEASAAELVRLARGTLDFVLRELTLPNGAFKSAIDAETDAVEGAFYVWTRNELDQVLGEEGAKLLGPILGFDGKPNFEHDRYTLYLTASLDEHAERLGISREALLGRLTPHLEKLRAHRARREFPLVDDKVLTDWNGLMIAAMARAGSLLEEERYLDAAVRAAEFALAMVDDDGTQLHVWRGGEARIVAFVDDYAFLIRALLVLREATGEGRWLDQARRLSEQMERRLAAPGGGYYSSGEQSDLLVRALSASDGAIPSGNGIAVLNHLELARWTGDAEYRRRAGAALHGFAADLASGSRSAATLAEALFRYRSSTGARSSPFGELAQRVVSANARRTGETEDGSRPFEIRLEIEAGWHVNANPASLDFLVPTSIEGEVSRLVYPDPQAFRFEFAPKAIDVYSGSVRIRGELGEGADELRLTYQACDDTRCLPPVTRDLRLDG